MVVQPHFLLVTYPAQGHINPSLQFAKGLTRIGVLVTLVTSLSAGRRMSKTSFPDGLSFVTFSDGYDDGLKPGGDMERYASELKRRGSQTLNELIADSAKEGKPVTCVVYTMLLHWAADVARAQHLPAALLWIQPATVFDIYYYYFNGYGDIFNNCKDSSYVIELPGLPPLTSRDVPSFTLPSNTYTVAIQAFQEQLEHLSQETNPKVVNSFDALELGPMNATHENLHTQNPHTQVGVVSVCAFIMVVAVPRRRKHKRAPAERWVDEDDGDGDEGGVDGDDDDVMVELKLNKKMA
ncbi:hypothetical protein DKX38_003490 [Salix brachista]|uniref:Uncharacterized protein n=1 Tax=Salix brachista TaxID=2182728 RepID=A0A5N5NRJ3_9ROSI|nr:hypothetical protein DKX38_003490 [Salix brachista]